MGNVGARGTRLRAEKGEGGGGTRGRVKKRRREGKREEREGRARYISIVYVGSIKCMSAYIYVCVCILLSSADIQCSMNDTLLGIIRRHDAWPFLLPFPFPCSPFAPPTPSPARPARSFHTPRALAQKHHCRRQLSTRRIGSCPRSRRTPATELGKGRATATATSTSPPALSFDAVASEMCTDLHAPIFTSDHGHRSHHSTLFSSSRPVSTTTTTAERDLFSFRSRPTGTRTVSYAVASCI